MDRADVVRQQIADAEYVAACREAGIQPQRAEYKIHSRYIDATDPAVAHWIEAHKDPLSQNPGDQEACQLSEVLRKLISAIVSDQPPSKQSIRAAGSRLVILAYALGIEPFASETALAGLAKKLGVSRALLSYYGLQLQDSLGVHVVGAKSHEARKNLARARQKAVKEGKADTRNAPWKMKLDS
jgi:hypothetical protein